MILSEMMNPHMLQRAGTTVSTFTLVFPELAWHIDAQ